MNFIEAFTEAMKGKRIRRAWWGASGSVEADDPRHNRCRLWWNYYKGLPYNMTFEDATATDWEVVE